MGNDNSRPSDIKGLPSLGNTCYINVIVQCLSVTPHFLEFLTKDTSAMPSVSTELRNLINELHTNEDDLDNDVSTVALHKKLMYIYDGRYTDKDMQHDAFQFMQDLISVLHFSYLGEKTQGLFSNLNKIIHDCKWSSFPISDKGSVCLLSDKNINADMIQIMNSNHHNYISHFGNTFFTNDMLVQMQVTMECTKCSNRFISFPCSQYVDIPLLNSATYKYDEKVEGKSMAIPTDLEICLDRLSNGVDVTWMCQHCKCNVTAHRRVRIQRASNILILRVGRVAKKVNSKSKTTEIRIDRTLIFPEEKFLIDSFPNGELASYSLYATVNHIGTATKRGHFVCHIRSNITNEWYTVNDDETGQFGSWTIPQHFDMKSKRDIENNPTLWTSKDSYILFFRRSKIITNT